MTIWCWVRDLSTGHHFDIPLRRLDHLEAIGAVREIPGRRKRSYQPRKPKHFRPLGRGPAVLRPSQPQEGAER